MTVKFKDTQSTMGTFLMSPQDTENKVQKEWEERDEKERASS